MGEFLVREIMLETSLQQPRTSVCDHLTVTNDDMNLFRFQCILVRLCNAFGPFAVTNFVNIGINQNFPLSDLKISGLILIIFFITVKKKLKKQTNEMKNRLVTDER